MIYILVGIVIAAYGVWYAADPARWLKNKYTGDEVPPVAVRTARIVGCVITLIGVIVVIGSIVRLITNS